MCAGVPGDLGLRVVAEGIETEHQRQALLATGCSLGEGWDEKWEKQAGDWI